MFLRPFGLYRSACFGILFLSILCTCCSHFFWYWFISFTMFCAPVFSLIHWFFSLSNFVIPSKCLKNFISSASKRCSSLFFSTQASLPNFNAALAVMWIINFVFFQYLFLYSTSGIPQRKKWTRQVWRSWGPQVLRNDSGFERPLTRTLKTSATQEPSVAAAANYSCTIPAWNRQRFFKQVPSASDRSLKNCRQKRAGGSKRQYTVTHSLPVLHYAPTVSQNASSGVAPPLINRSVFSW